MDLYYNYDKCCFSTADGANCKKVFETHHSEGWANPPTIIEEGRFKLVINTNFYPKSPHREFMLANLFLDGIKLLPVSQAAHITKSTISVGLDELAFNQYGPGESKGKTPCTYYSKQMDWNNMLNTICDISENAGEWQNREFKSLLAILKQKKSFESSPVIIGRLIDLFTPYEKILVSSLYPMIQSNAIAAMLLLLNMIVDDEIDSKRKASMLNYGDLIWKCVKYNANYAV